MAKEVTVLALEGEFLRGVRLAESGGTFVRQMAEVWSLDATGEKTAAGEEGQEASSVTSEAAEEGAAPADEDGESAKAEVLALALHDAATRFGTREFILSVPLSRLLVHVFRLPVEERENLEEVAQSEIEKVSPFPDEPLVVGMETVAETDKELVVAAAALPAAAAEDISEALAAAKVNVTRTDVTALGRLRAYWPQICAKENASRRVVLMNLDDGWDVIVLDDGAPIFLRGLGDKDFSPDELGREVMISLLQGEGLGGARPIEDVVVFAKGPVDPAILERLGTFGPVRLAQTVDDEFESVEGVAQRAVEGVTCDVTPEAWTVALREARFKKKLTIGVSGALAVWLAIMGVFFGVPFVYGQLTARQTAQSRRHKTAYEETKSIQTKLKMVKGYSDREHGALMLLKRISDELPEGTRLREFTYMRDDAVFVQGEVDQDKIAYAYKNALVTLRNEDDSRLFPEVELSGLRQNKFKMSASLKEPDEDEPAPRSSARGRSK